jgi:hypothetical protein
MDMMEFEGKSNALDDSEAGFRAATRAAVEEFKAQHGEKREEPVRLRVKEMYVEVQNPIHDYIVVLEQAP